MTAGDIGANIRTYLLTKSAITNLLGASGQVFSDELPQRGQYTMPVIVYRIISGNPVRHLTGSSNKTMTRLQIDSIASSRASAGAVAEAVRKNLEMYSGAAGSDTVDIAHGESARYDYDEPTDSSEDGLYSHSQDYLIHHSQPAVST